MEKIRKHAPWLVTVVTVVAVIAIYFLALRTGASFVFYGLRWPDTCWLLKFGKIILETGHVPQFEPFSFSPKLLLGPGQNYPIVVYQWLSELLFFWWFRAFKVGGLLCACSLVLLAAYVILPLRSCINAKISPAWTITAITLASLSSNVRSVVRPEIFSCLFMAITLMLLQGTRSRAFASQSFETEDEIFDEKARSKDSKTDEPISESSEAPEAAAAESEETAIKQGIDWNIVILLLVVSVIWCNMHSAFVVGLIIIWLYAIAFALDDRQSARAFSAATKTAVLAALSSTLATLINPYGIGLWAYLPHLFFMPINAQIDECKPLLGVNISLAIYYYALIALCIGAIALSIKRAREAHLRLGSTALMSALFIFALAAVSGLLVRRLSSLSALIMLFETASFIHCTGDAGDWSARIWRGKLSYAAIELVSVILAFFGVLQTGSSFALTIPAATSEFIPPFKAIQVFLAVRQGGNVMATLPLSDMLDLYSPVNPSLLIDSRMDVYSDSIISDYLSLLHATDNWKSVLQKYKIEWVFLSPEKPLCGKLAQDPFWVLVYRDSAAMIFHHGPLTGPKPVIPGMRFTNPAPVPGLRQPAPQAPH